MNTLYRIVWIGVFCLGALFVPTKVANAQLTGTLNVPGSYATLAAAITDLNAQGVGAGGVTLNVVAGNPQTAPAGGYEITASGSAANPIVIRGNNNTVTAFTPQPANAKNDAIFKIIGGDFITLRGFDIQENAANNTSTTATEWGVALLNASASDGPQNIILRNLSIDLNILNRNSTGVYSNALHNASDPTVLVAPTTSGAAHSGLQIIASSITEVAHPIVVVGPNQASFHNNGLIIGGSVANANTLSNVMKDALGYSFVGVNAAQTTGILVRNVINYTITHNTIDAMSNSSAAPNARMIHVSDFDGDPVGAISNSISNNTLKVFISGTDTAGIAVDSGTDNNQTSLIVQQNLFQPTVAQASTWTGIRINSVASSTTISNNTFDGLSKTATGIMTLISNAGIRPNGATVTVQGNSIVNGLTWSSGGSSLAGLSDGISSTGVVNSSYQNNNFSGVTVSTTATGTSLAGMVIGGSGVRRTITGNVISNWVSTAPSSTKLVGLSVSGSDETHNNNMVFNNTFSGLQNVGSTIGIDSVDGRQNFVGNRLFAMQSSSEVVGIRLQGGAQQVVAGNRIYDLLATSTTGKSLGIQVYDCGCAYEFTSKLSLFNNLIADLKAPSTTGSSNIAAFDFSIASPDVDVFYNTVYLTGSGTSPIFGASVVKLSLSGSYLVLFKNNSFTNAVTGIALIFSDIFLNRYNLNSDYNNYFVSLSGAANGMTPNLSTLAEFQDETGSESHSIAEAPNFLSLDGAQLDFLHLNSAIPTQHESAGTPIAGISVDVDNTARAALRPDIGADEIVGTILDFSGPLIQIPTLLPIRIPLQTANLLVRVQDPSGVATAGNVPRLYFRKNGGAYVSTACVLQTAPNYQCGLTLSALGGAVGGDDIDYFVAAQDTLGNVRSHPAANLVATSVNNITTPPNSPHQTQFGTSYSGVVTVGAGGTFASLTNLGGLFNALNDGVLTGDLEVRIVSDLSAESGIVGLLATVETGAGGYDITVMPSGIRTVTLTTGAIAFVASRVNFDGLNTATDRLILRTSSCSIVSGPASAFNVEGSNALLARMVFETCRTNPVVFVLGNDVQVRENEFRGNNLSGLQSYSQAILIESSSGQTQVVLNRIRDFNARGIEVSSNNIAASLISNNEVYESLNPISALKGIRIAGAGSHDVALNRLHHLRALDTLNMIEVINLNGTVLVRNNKIDALDNSITTPTIIGVLIDNAFSGSTVADLQNNFIAIESSAPRGQTGIQARSTVGPVDAKLRYNSIYLSGTGSNTVSSAVRMDSALFDLHNNVVFNNRSNTTGVQYAVLVSTTFANVRSSNHNVFKGAAPDNSSFFFFNGAKTFAVWQAQGAAFDPNSSVTTALATDFFVDANLADLHLKPSATAALNLGMPLPDVSFDIDTQARDATTPDIGADEVPPNLPPVFNSIPTITVPWGSNNTGPFQIATVSDPETLAGDLTITAITGGTASGYTLSSITNTTGTINARVTSTCGATPGTQRLQVSDGFNNVVGNLTINGSADPAPTLTYNQAVPVNLPVGGGTTVLPLTGPSDNGSIASIVVDSQGSFTGTVSVNPTTAVVTLANAGPASAGQHAITIRITDNCGNSRTASFGVLVGFAPTVTTLTLAPANTSVTGQAILANVNVATPAPTNIPATGNVNLSLTPCLYLAPCSQTLALVNGQVSFNLNSIAFGGPVTVTANYLGNTDFASSFDNKSHSVTTANTSLSLSGPVNGRVGANMNYAVVLAGVLPSTGNPAPIGNITIASGADSCSFAVPISLYQCAINFLTPGVKTVTASYTTTDPSYAPSTSNTVNTTIRYEADLSISKTNNTSIYGANEVLNYTITVRNNGPDIISNVRVRDTLPPELINATWTCNAGAGAPCGAITSGNGNIDYTVNGQFFVNSSHTVNLTAQVNGSPAQISNTATVNFTSNDYLDSNSSNDSATDTDTQGAIFKDGFE